MSELRIIRGTDVKLYVVNTPLFGVTAFSAVRKTAYHEVYEYLSAKPCERIPQGSYYEIKLSVMSLFDRQLPEEPGFVLRVVDGDTSYCYDNCRITGQRTKLNENDTAVEEFTIEADNMRKRWSRE